MKPESIQNEVVGVVHDATVTFDGYATRALSRVDMEVRGGEVLGVLGAKGAGKSTLLKILAGRLKPIEGAVKVFGRSPRWGTAKARIGYLPEVSDSGASQGFLSRLFPRRKATAVSSGGSRLAHAILGNRDLFILDEPLGGLGPAEKADAKHLIRELVGLGKTVVLSSDSLTDIKDLCQRIAVIHEGKIQAVGTLTELLAMGSAIRFLPPVLPRSIVDRVLNVLREEILSESLPAQNLVLPVPAVSPKVRPKDPEPPTAPASDQLLTQLAKPPEGARPPVAEKESIDHGKLEELTKPNKSK